ncbi:DUF2062 domain-containing protein [Roseomonas sp. CCTCC AB2023176]|uniref:DUF2062 domain-containing protein n=1 Tax=Roseomonas sp. CCTCC AB2023176 TaxID=3342640 RepID=UPI0035E040CE
MAARLRTGWAGLLASPGGPSKVARGIGAGAFAAMLPAFGLHLIFAATAAFLVRGSLPAAGAACVLFGNPLTHAILIPLEYEIGRLLMPGHGPHWIPKHGPAWLIQALPAGEHLALGGLLVGAVVGPLAYAVARWAVRKQATASPL